MRTATRLAAALLLLTAGPAAAQEPPADQVSVPAGGTDLFRALLDRAGIRPVTWQELDDPGARSGDIIVVVLGNIDALNHRHHPLYYANRAARAGGAVLIAADTPLYLEPWFRPGMNADAFPVRVDGRRVENPNPDRHLRFPDCPYAVPIAPDDLIQDVPAGPGPAWKVFDGLNRVATNGTSFLQVFPGDVFQYPLARFPPGSQVVVRPGGFGRPRIEPPPPTALFAVGGDEVLGLPGGRALLLADHSVFINQMLLEPGTDNLELAYRTIDFLRGPLGRKRCAFFENGRLVDKFDDLRQKFAPPLPPLPAINLERMQEQLVDFGNAIADRLQASDLPGRLFAGEAGDERYRDVLLVAVVVAGICAAVFLLRKVWKARKPTDTPAPPGIPGAPTGPPGVFDRRQKELLRRNNVYEPVRDLVRDFFATLGVRGDPGPRVPPVEVSRAVRKADSLREAIRDFWRLAFGPPQVVTVGRWRELEPYFERVRKAHADGKWTFPTAGPLETA